MWQVSHQLFCAGNEQITICEQLTVYLAKYAESTPAPVEADAGEPAETVLPPGMSDMKIYIKPVVAVCLRPSRSQGY
jgi:hypothetical protein